MIITKQKRANKKCIFVDVVRIFFGNRSYVLLLLPFIIVGYAALNVWGSHHIADTNVGFGFWDKIIAQTSVLSQLIAGALVMLNAVLINMFFNRNGFMERNTYLPALLYVVLTSFFHSFYFLDGWGVAQTFFVLSLSQLLQLKQNEDARSLIFNAAFLVGLALTFDPLMLCFVVFLFWIIWVIRPFVFRELILALIGLILPLVYAGIYKLTFQIELTNDHLSPATFESGFKELIVLGAIVVLLFFLSLNGLREKLQKSSIRLKKLFKVILVLLSFSFFLALIAYLLFQKKEVLSVLIVPLMFIFPYAFGYRNLKNSTTIVFYVLFLFSVCKFFFPLYFLASE